ncbi:MAG: AAA family ATPase [Propionibacteriaceae bacterium]|jgi:predicted ATPase|nr:AAA family ATPase [Propionibacteriaceae bacterium]
MAVEWHTGLVEAWLDLPEGADARAYPYGLPAVRALAERPLAFHPRMTLLVGENGSGKSTLLEAVAVALGFNPEGGSRNFNFATRASHSSLHEVLRIARRGAVSRGFFFRAESFFNVATEIERLGVEEYYGRTPLHEMSHGEAFLTLVQERFQAPGLYLLDEPEAALSPARQLTVLAELVRLADAGCQFVVATHSPILMAFPDAWIYECGPDGLGRVDYGDTAHVQIMAAFLAHPERTLRHLLEP